MNKLSRIRYACICSLALIVVGAGSALADTGDIYKVTRERVNLRAGPSDEADVRSTLKAGDELIELQKEGSWLGVRTLGSNEEGWIYGELVDRVSQSFLHRDATPVPVEKLSKNFDSLLESIDNYLGYRIVDRIEETDNHTLRVTPTSEWLLYASRDAHLMAALTFYQIWKTHQNGRPVNLVMVDSQSKDYIGIHDEGSGPVLSVEKLHQQ